MSAEKNVTFIIPIFKLQGHRVSNLRFILPYLVATGHPVYVVEQLNRKSELSDLISDVKGATHVAYRSEEKTLHKTALINWAVKNLAFTRYAWVNDVDFYMRYQVVLDQPWKDSFIQPYRAAKKLGDASSTNLKKGIPTDVSYEDPTAHYVSMYSALSFVFKVKAFLKLGGMDESYIGCAMEDCAFHRRVMDKAGIQVMPFLGVHLYHPEDGDKLEISHNHSELNSQSARDMAIVTCYFNWGGFQSPKRNLTRFLDRMREEKRPVYGVELSLDGNFETKGIDGWRRITVGHQNVCFQKEACLNLAEKSVPSRFTKIAWIDCDFQFLNPEWYEETSRALNKYRAVQMFSRYLPKTKDGRIPECIPSMMMRGGPKPNPNGKGHVGAPGGAFAAQREMWQHGGLYPYSFMGGGDCAFIYSIFNEIRSDQIRKSVGVYYVGVPEFDRWRTSLVKWIRNSISYVEGDAVHDWHGDRQNRNYVARHALHELAIMGRNVRLNKDGILEITGMDSQFYENMMNYFRGRKEDGENA